MLTKHLSIREWLLRAVRAAQTSQASIDSPSFSADVTIKFNGAGSYTYTFPAATDLLSLSAYYSLQETLSINFTSKPKVDKLVTLPVGGVGTGSNQARSLMRSTVTILEDQQSSLQQIRQTLQNLKSVTQ